MSAWTGEGALAPLCLRYPARAPASLPTPRRLLPRLRDSRARAPWPPLKISPPTPPENPAASHLPRPYPDDPPPSSAPPRSQAPSAAPCQVSAAPPPRRASLQPPPAPALAAGTATPCATGPAPTRRASVEPPRAPALTAGTATPRAAGEPRRSHLPRPHPPGQPRATLRASLLSSTLRPCQITSPPSRAPRPRASLDPVHAPAVTASTLGTAPPASAPPNHGSSYLQVLDQKADYLQLTNMSIDQTDRLYGMKVCC